MAKMSKREEIIDRYKCEDPFGESCSHDCEECKQNLAEDLDEYKAEVIEEFCEGYKNFQTDENICDLQEDCSFSGGWCIDCFKDKWLKEQNSNQLDK